MIKGKTVIVHIEDNQAHATLIQRQLSQLCPLVEIVHFIDGEKALNYVGEIGPETGVPKLFLVDLRLPKVDGFSVLRQLRQMDNFQKTPVIILTTSSAQNDVTEAYRCGASGYLIKPLDSARLREMLKSLCDFWLNWNVDQT